MLRKEIWATAEEELRKDRKNHPWWPIHPASCAGRVCVPSGELMSSCLAWKYNRAESENVQTEQKQAMTAAALQVIVNAIRFLENLDKLKVDTEKEQTVLTGLL